jgi:hypothetical protein
MQQACSLSLLVGSLECCQTCSVLLLFLLLAVPASQNSEAYTMPSSTGSHPCRRCSYYDSLLLYALQARRQHPHWQFHTNRPSYLRPPFYSHPACCPGVRPASIWPQQPAHVWRDGPGGVNVSAELARAAGTCGAAVQALLCR